MLPGFAPLLIAMAHPLPAAGSLMALTACTSGQPMTWEKINQV